MTMTTEDERRSQLIGEVLYLARTRVHRLDQRQLDKLQHQTTASIMAMHAYLLGRPVNQEVAAQAQDWERQAWAAQDQAIAAVPPGGITAQVAKATQAALEAADQARPSTFMTDQQLAATRPHVRVPEADQVQAEGYILHEGTLYKVQRAIYGSGKLYAKRLDLQAGEFVIAKGMMSYLRESERIDEAQAIEFGRELEVTPEMGIYGKCILCGRPLTDEDSIRNRVGPGPHKGA
jgi:Family of unknown function (DUF6011)